VVLEALDAGLPVVGFEGTGGVVALTESGCVFLAPAFGVSGFAGEVARLLSDIESRQLIHEKAASLIARDYEFNRYIYDLLQCLPVPSFRVSVVVPNYNYLRYLSERLNSVAQQTLRPYEVIVLDDASADGSREWLESNLQHHFYGAELVVGERNSGSVFRQWLNGVKEARGEYVWIAEADDVTDPSFLEVVTRAFMDPDVVLSYVDSQAICQDGTVLGDYYEYLSDIGQGNWQRAYTVEGEREIREHLAVKNTIPNVSAVVFRRQALLEVLLKNFEEISSFSVAGDWVTYLRLAATGKVAFSPSALNLHRRHESSVTLGENKLRHLREILRVQRLAQDVVDVPDESIRLACAFAQKVYEDFGLATTEWPTVFDHPSLRDLAGCTSATSSAG
jgi:glycosyltransferase involved in cell wall biosynthesis